MSKSNDGDKFAEAPAMPPTDMQMLKEPMPVVKPYPRPSEGRTLGDNEAQAEFKVAMVENKDTTIKPAENTPKPTQAQKQPETTPTAAEPRQDPKRQDFAEKVGTERKAYNEDNNLAKGKSLYDIKPAAAAMPIENAQAPKAEPQKPSFTDRFKNLKPPVKPDNNTPKPDTKTDIPKSSFTERIKAPLPRPQSPPPSSPKR